MEGLSTFLQSFSNTFTPIIDFIRWAFPKVYRIHDGERGLVLTGGKVRRKEPELGPGWHWVYPFEECEVYQCEGEFSDLHGQTLSTKDHKIAVVNASVEYRLSDLRLACLLTDELEQLIQSTCENELREYARTHEMADLTDSGTLVGTITNRANKRLARHGVTIVDFMISDMRPHDMSLATDTARDLMTVFLKLRISDERKS